jgi:hypothetical protein
VCSGHHQEAEVAALRSGGEELGEPAIAEAAAGVAVVRCYRWWKGNDGTGAADLPTV